MKIYRRIFQYAKLLRGKAPLYLIFTLLAVIFGLVNFILLQPLFEVIFDQLKPEQLETFKNKPEFAFSIEYFTQYFYYHFIKYTEASGKLGALLFVCVILIVANFFANIFKYLSLIISATIRADMVKNLRDAIFKSISKLHIGFFSNERKGDIMSRITNDVQEVEWSAMYVFQVVLKEPLTLIAFFTVLFYMSPTLTLFTLVILPIAGFIISGIAKRLKKAAVSSQETLGRLLNITEESLSGMRVVKAFTAENFVTKKFMKEDEKYSHIRISMAKKQELASPLSEFLGIFTISGILLYGGNQVLNEGLMEAAKFLTYLILFSQVLNPAKEISKAITALQRGAASAERIFEIIDTAPKIVNAKDAVEKLSFEDSLVFKNVSFEYDEDKKVLDNINLTVTLGKTIALVGPSGGGKSTLADLIPRFHDPSAGEILLDGTDIKNIKVESVRNLMGIVTQESILFNDTVFNNIAFGIENANEEEVIKAAKIANAHEFIIKMEHGYQTEIGERGTKLSGGQRQRLSIARAVFKNPPILILDEATSALDSASEKLVQEALTNLMQNRTSIVIAHRLSTIQHADEILVVKDGKIAERGTHDTLLQEKGIYYKLIEMQAF